MTNKNYFFSEEQENLSNEFFRECPSKKIALENMLENFGYEYEYSKMAVCSGVFCVVKIYIGLSFLGTFFYEDLFDSFGVSKSAYSLLENFGWVIKEVKKNGKIQ